MVKKRAVRCHTLPGVVWGGLDGTHLAAGPSIHPPIAMFRTLLKSKIHRASVTHCELNYEGSCAIDEDLLDAANLGENEQVHIWNINNGERFITYAIRAERGSGIISVNGSAARRAAVGDLVIIAAFAQVHEDQVKGFEPKLVFVNPDNRIKEKRSTIPVQMA
jgi:aspartate 1-decarboxylase